MRYNLSYFRSDGLPWMREVNGLSLKAMTEIYVRFSQCRRLTQIQRITLTKGQGRERVFYKRCQEH